MFTSMSMSVSISVSTSMSISMSLSISISTSTPPSISVKCRMVSVRWSLGFLRGYLGGAGIQTATNSYRYSTRGIL